MSCPGNKNFKGKNYFYLAYRWYTNSELGHSRYPINAYEGGYSFIHLLTFAYSLIHLAIQF